MDPSILHLFAVNKSDVIAKNKDGIGAYYMVLVIIAKFIKLLAYFPDSKKAKVGL
jgi:hypothetical protein